jgi:hypothetical protein
MSQIKCDALHEPAMLWKCACNVSLIIQELKASYRSRQVSSCKIWAVTEC